MMLVSEEKRRALFDRVRMHLDEETATLLLEVTMPANVELSTRGDVQELRAELLLRIGDLDGRLTQQIGDLDRRLTGQIADLDARFSDRLFRVVVPTVIGATTVIVAVATWVGTLVG